MVDLFAGKGLSLKQHKLLEDVKNYERFGWISKNFENIVLENFGANF